MCATLSEAFAPGARPATETDAMAKRSAGAPEGEEAPSLRSAALGSSAWSVARRASAEAPEAAPYEKDAPPVASSLLAGMAKRPCSPIALWRWAAADALRFAKMTDAGPADALPAPKILKAPGCPASRPAWLAPSAIFATSGCVTVPDQMPPG